MIDFIPKLRCFVFFSFNIVFALLSCHTSMLTQTQELTCLWAPTKPGLFVKFHSSPLWKFLKIKFHLLQLGFHHKVRSREAETCLVPLGNKKLSMHVLFFVLSLHFTFLLLFPHPLNTIANFIPNLTLSLLSLSFYSSKIRLFFFFFSCLHLSPAQQFHVKRAQLGQTNWQQPRDETKTSSTHYNG